MRRCVLSALGRAAATELEMLARVQEQVSPLHLEV
jgi:hypothetical protein